MADTLKCPSCTRQQVTRREGKIEYQCGYCDWYIERGENVFDIQERKRLHIINNIESKDTA